jgi:hypothetical protein
LPKRCGEVIGRLLEVFLCRHEAWVRAELLSAETWAPLSLWKDKFADLEFGLPFDFPQLDAAVGHCASPWLLWVWRWREDASAVGCTVEGLGDVGDRVRDVSVHDAEGFSFRSQTLDKLLLVLATERLGEKAPTRIWGRSETGKGMGGGHFKRYHEVVRGGLVMGSPVLE